MSYSAPTKRTNTHHVAAPILGPHISRCNDTLIVDELANDIALLVREFGDSDVPADLVYSVLNVREEM